MLHIVHARCEGNEALAEITAAQPSGHFDDGNSTIRKPHEVTLDHAILNSERTRAGLDHSVNRRRFGQILRRHPPTILKNLREVLFQIVVVSIGKSRRIHAAIDNQTLRTDLVPRQKAFGQNEAVV